MIESYSNDYAMHFLLVMRSIMIVLLAYIYTECSLSSRSTLVVAIALKTLRAAPSSKRNNLTCQNHYSFKHCLLHY